MISGFLERIEFWFTARKAQTPKHSIKFIAGILFAMGKIVKQAFSIFICGFWYFSFARSIMK